MKHRDSWLFSIVVFLLLLASGGLPQGKPLAANNNVRLVYLPAVLSNASGGETPLPTATSTSVVTPQQTATATATVATSTATEQATLTATPTSTATSQATVTATPTPSGTPTKMPTATPTPTGTPTKTPTATPTRTGTPTKTPTATPTPTATATLPASSVYVLANHSSYLDSIDYLHIVGEVKNDTNHDLRFVKVSAALYDSGGRLLDTEFTYVTLGILPAHDKACFHLLLPEPASWTRYEFADVEYWDDANPPPNLLVSNHSGSYDSTFGWYEIIGQVRNNEGQRLEYVSPVGTLYNQAGTVLGCTFSYVTGTHLDPGQKSSFEMLFVGRDFKGVRSYRLQVDANPANYRRWLDQQR